MQLRDNLDQDKMLITAWSTSASSDMAAGLARCPFDAVTVDMQHGAHSESSAFASVQAVAAVGKPAILRIPVGRNDLASRALDMGFEAVIAPMINSVADAEAFANAMKYPPLGERSWGPTKALHLHGSVSPDSYFKTANRQTLAFAMIETRAAIAALDGILAQDGIDGVFVGPSDLSISWTDGAGVDPRNAALQDVIADIASRARDAGKFAAVFAVDPADVPGFARMGYRLAALNTDPGILQAGAAVMLAQAKG
ncbi:aldolase/citrate lyase family protein [Hoeflea sp. YIM 152468]|uniref:HpcH/HpaI aldolase family protein n=1 Tax=Hoeflea sp. YIM 152468 TaxID=3031759 RepID=UPI0023DB2583|nr:aldolase/citrate lyase family protein [Hoeflea sp. YIM 152468]MDF1607472.1 aldolase/citrate lyase family protein [Hoeflea sp. YIM 152468]